MHSFKPGDKIRLIRSHYLFNDWAINKTGVVRQKMIGLDKQSYAIEIDGRIICVEARDLENKEDHQSQQTIHNPRESQ